MEPRRTPREGASSGGAGGAYGARGGRGPPSDISELLVQALDTYRGEWAAPVAMGTEDFGELIAQAVAASRPKGEVSTPDVAKRAEEAVKKLSGEADSEGTSTERGMGGMQEKVANQGAMATCGERAEIEGVEDWMWEWRGWRQVASREPCPAGLVYSMDVDTGTSHA